MEKVKKEDIAKLQCKIAMLEADVECNRTRLDHFVNLVMELRREIFVLKNPDQKLFVYDPITMTYKRMEV
jgi:hypothetical protein